jgi:hypothetical protein
VAGGGGSAPGGLSTARTAVVFAGLADVGTRDVTSSRAGPDDPADNALVAAPTELSGRVAADGSAVAVVGGTDGSVRVLEGALAAAAAVTGAGEGCSKLAPKSA